MSRRTAKNIESDSFPIFRDPLITLKRWATSLRKINIKEVYSFEESLTNKIWIDGSPVYRRVINFGVMPNSGTKNVAHNTFFKEVVSLYGIGTGVIAGVGKAFFPIPYHYSGTTEAGMYMGPKNITIRTTTDYTAYTAMVFVEYTKQ